MFRRWWAVVAVAALCGPLLAAPDDDDKPKPGKAVAKPPEDDDSPAKRFPPFDKVTKGAEVVGGGLMTLYKKDNTVLLELEPQHLGRPFLLPVAVARGAGLGGSTLNFGEEWVVLFRRVAPDTVHLVRRNTRFRADGGPAGKAVENQYLDSVLQSLPVRTVNPSKGSVLIDLNQIFFADFAQLGLGGPDPSRTTWGKVKAFKRNLTLEVQATFGGSSRSGRGYFGGTDGVIDDRGVTVVLHYGLAELPDGGYTPRLADTRVGHFLSAVKDFSRDDPDTSFVRMVNRWRLERADGSPWKDGAKLQPPKKRIVYWIEDTVPDEYRTAVREGILQWNTAFERIGFKDAIEVRQQDGQEFDPEDIGYATFRWITTDTPFAVGPSRANPLTGEILDADILFDASFVQAYKQEYRLFRDDAGRPVEPASMVQALHRGWELPFHPLAFRNSPFGWDHRADPPLPPAARQWQRLTAGPHGHCQCAAHKRTDLAVAGFAAAAARAADGKAALEALLQQAVKETTMHEVGHTLGLRHNFKASTMLANDDLHNPAVTRTRGLVGSVMDYNPANIAPKGTPQGDYFTAVLGPYDFWAIDYAYRPLAGGAGDKAELQKIAGQVARPELVYGTDEDLYASADPFINLFDLGRDPLRFGRDRIQLAESLFATLADTAVDNGESYARLRLAFGLLLGQYGDAAYLASRFVGGAAVSRDHKGDPGGRDPLTPVPGDKQREALAFLQEHILTDRPFRFPPALLRKLGTDKWSHWGTPGVYGRGGEFPVNERVLAIQRVALDELLDAGTLGRLQNQARTAAAGDTPLSVAEVFRALTDGVFADLPAGGASRPGPRQVSATAAAPPADRGDGVVARNLQRAYVQKLAELVLGPKADGFPLFFVARLGGGGEVPADAKALARLHLREVAGRAKAGLTDAADDTARAHLQELAERVGKVLDARPTANEP